MTLTAFQASDTAVTSALLAPYRLDACRMVALANERKPLFGRIHGSRAASYQTRPAASHAWPPSVVAAR